MGVVSSGDFHNNVVVLWNKGERKWGEVRGKASYIFRREENFDQL